MWKKLIALSVVFGLIVAEPVAKLSAPAYDDLSYYPTYMEVKSATPEKEAKTLGLLAKPDLISLGLDLVTAVVGYKASAVSIAVAIIGWIVSNFVVLALGALGTLGLCKLTGKCTLLEQFIPVVNLHDLVTPERLETAEEIFVKAVKRYAEENKSKEANN